MNQTAISTNIVTAITCLPHSSQVNTSLSKRHYTAQTLASGRLQNLGIFLYPEYGLDFSPQNSKTGKLINAPNT